MAKPAAAAKTKKKIKRVVTDGIAHVHASFNNIVNISLDNSLFRKVNPLKIYPCIRI
jgi:ribosomal protein S11